MFTRGSWVAVRSRFLGAALAVLLAAVVLASPRAGAVSAIADGGFESGSLPGPYFPPMPLSFGHWESETDSGQLAQAPQPVHSGAWSAVVDTMNAAIGSVIVQDFDSGTDSYTLTFWVYPAAGIEGGGVVYNWDRGVTGARDLGSAFGMSLTSTGFVAWDTAVTLAPISYGAWHEIRIVADRCTRTQDLYVDGVLWGSATATTSAIMPTGAATIYFGDGAYNARHGKFYYDDFSFESFICGRSSCPLSQGFWKTHPAAWPVSWLSLGAATYTKADLMGLLNTPVRGDASLILAKQLIAAKVNIANGSDPTPVAATIAQADDLLATHSGVLPYAVMASSPEGQTMVALASVLDQFNNGKLTPGCPSESDSSIAVGGWLIPVSPLESRYSAARFAT